MNNTIKSLANGDFEVIPLDDPLFLKSQHKRRIDDMIIELHDIARETNNTFLRRIADQLSEAKKEL